MTDVHQYSIPKQPGGWRAMAFAALVHLALLAFFWIGISWQSETPATIEAEIWDPQPKEAAPLPEPVRQEPRPEPKPEPKPVVKETPPPPPPKPKAEEPPQPKVDIALEREKKRKEEERKRREEEEERREQEQKRLETEKQAKEKKAKEEKLAKEKAEKEKAEKLKAEKEKAEKARKEKEAADKKRKQQEADERLAAKMRDEEMRRMTGAVGTGGSGEAARSQGGRASSEYGSRIGAKIKSNITFVAPEGLPGNPPVEYEVKLLPDGSIAGMRKLRSSGVPGFDEAVARAIERSQPFPKDSNGSVPSTFIGIHKPKDQ